MYKGTHTPYYHNDGEDREKEHDKSARFTIPLVPTFCNINALGQSTFTTWNYSGIILIVSQLTLLCLKGIT